MRNKKILVFIFIAILLAVAMFRIDTAKCTTPSTVGTVGSNGYLSDGISRNTFYDDTNGYFYVFYFNVTAGYYGYRSNKTTSWTASTRFTGIVGAIGVGCFSTWYNGTHCSYVYSTMPESDGDTIKYSIGATNSSGLISFGTEVTAVSAVVNNDYHYPQVFQDSSNYPVICYIKHRYVATVITLCKFKIATTTMGTTWGTETALNTTTSATWAITGVPLTGRDLYFIQGASGNKLYGVFWDSSESSKTINQAVSTSTIKASDRMSAVAMGDNIYVAFQTSMGAYTQTKFVNGTTSSWNAEMLGVNATGDVNMMMSTDGTNIYYITNKPILTASVGIIARNYTSSTWGSVWTVVNETANGQGTAIYEVTASYAVRGNKISIAWMTHPSTYNLRHTFMGALTNTEPTNDSCAITDADTGTVYAQRKFYTFSVNVTDADGVTNLDYVELRLEHSAGSYSDADCQVRWTEATGIFSILGTNGTHINLGVGASSETTVGTQARIIFKIAFSWDYPLSSGIDAQVYTVDDSLATDTDNYALNLNYGNTVVLSGTTLTANETRGSISTKVTISGTLIYSGTVITIPDAQITSIAVHNVADASQGTGTTSSGAFSIVITLPASVSNNTYHVYMDGSDATFVDADIGAPTTVIVVSEKVTITLTATDDYINCGDTGVISATGVFQSDNSAWSGTVTLNSSTLVYITPIKHYYTTSSITDPTYGVLVFDTNVEDIIWDSLTISITDPTDQCINTGVNASGVQVTAIYNYDSHAFDGTFTLNSTTWSYSSVGKHGYTVSSVSGGTHGITSIGTNDVTYCIWDDLVVSYKAVSSSIVNNGTASEVRFKLRSEYFGTAVGDSSVSINGSAATWDGVNSWWDISTSVVSSVTRRTYVVTAATWSLEGITALKTGVTTNSSTITWDRDTIVNFAYSVGTVFNLTAKARSVYDNAGLNSKAITVRVYVNGTLYFSATTTTSATGAFSIVATKNLYNVGTLTFNLTNTADNIISSSYSCAYVVSVTNYSSSGVTINPLLFSAGDTMTIALMYKSVSYINATYVPLSIVRFVGVIYYNDGSPYGGTYSFSFYNGTKSNDWETKTDSMVVVLGDSGYFIDFELYMRSNGTDYLLGSANSTTFVVNPTVTPGPGGGSTTYPSLSVKVFDLKSKPIVGARVVIRDMYNATVCNMTTDTWGEVLTTLIMGGRYNVEASYYSTVKNKTVEMQQELQSEVFTFPVTVVITPKEFLVDTQSILLIVGAIAGIGTAIFLQRGGHTLSVIITCGLSVAMLLAGVLIGYKVFKPLVTLPSPSLPDSSSFSIVSDFFSSVGNFFANLPQKIVAFDTVTMIVLIGLVAGGSTSSFFVFRFFNRKGTPHRNRKVSLKKFSRKHKKR